MREKRNMNNEIEKCRIIIKKNIIIDENQIQLELILPSSL